MNDYITALLTGLSLGKLWLCVLLSYTLQTTDKRVCFGFLTGRLLSVLLLTLLISMVSKWIDIKPGILQMLSGTLLLIYASYLLCRYDIRELLSKNKTKKPSSSPPLSCVHSCEECPMPLTIKESSLCGECHKNTEICLADENKLNELHKMKNFSVLKNPQTSFLFPFIFGVSLGASRGSIFCGKFMLLLPLLLQASIQKGILIAIIFTLSSSLYPILGFILGAISLKWIKYKKALFCYFSSLSNTLLQDSIFYSLSGT